MIDMTDILSTMENISTTTKYNKQIKRVWNLAENYQTANSELFEMTNDK